MSIDELKRRLWYHATEGDPLRLAETIRELEREVGTIETTDVLVNAYLYLLNRAEAQKNPEKQKEIINGSWVVKEELSKRGHNFLPAAAV